MIRVIYLLHTDDNNYRSYLISLSVNGKKWTRQDLKSALTDREMVAVANKMEGWTESVYRFGCAFIHLSSFHDYMERDPWERISAQEQQAILKHLRYYHGGPLSDTPTIFELAFLIPDVFRKIHDNLESYLKGLENLYRRINNEQEERL